jgi:hypothetical protein
MAHLPPLRNLPFPSLASHKAVRPVKAGGGYLLSMSNLRAKVTVSSLIPKWLDLKDCLNMALQRTLQV